MRGGEEERRGGERKGEEREEEEAICTGMSELQQQWLLVQEYFLMQRCKI